MKLAVAVVLMAMTAVASVIFFPASSPIEAQQELVCRHSSDETLSEKARRTEALAYVRAINTAEARFAAAAKRYGSIGELAGVATLPVGFSSQLAADERGYLISVKDTTDACRYSLFSDQEGLIYVGSPLP